MNTEEILKRLAQYHGFLSFEQAKGNKCYQIFEPDSRRSTFCLSTPLGEVITNDFVEQILVYLQALEEISFESKLLLKISGEDSEFLDSVSSKITGHDAQVMTMKKPGNASFTIDVKTSSGPFNLVTGEVDSGPALQSSLKLSRLKDL